MITRIEEIKHIRKQLNLTQKELSKLSGVSQSAIAKIESGLMDPGFSLTRRIAEALQKKSESKMLKAKNVMNSPVKTIPVEMELKSVVTLIRKKNFSQFPVTDNNQVVGIISETHLLNAITQKNAKIKNIMGEAPPSVSPNSPLPIVIDLLHYFPLVLVTEKGKPTGIITKTDVLTKQK